MRWRGELTARRRPLTSAGLPEAKHKVAEEMLSRISSFKRETAEVEHAFAIEADDVKDVDLVEVMHLQRVPFLRVCCF